MTPYFQSEIPMHMNITPHQQVINNEHVEHMTAMDEELHAMETFLTDQLSYPWPADVPNDINELEQGLLEQVQRLIQSKNTYFRLNRVNMRSTSCYYHMGSTFPQTLYKRIHETQN